MSAWRNADRPLRIAVLASGSGTTLQAVIDACEQGALNARVVIVISNNSQSGAAERALRHGIPFRHLSGVTHPAEAELDQAIAGALEQSDPELVLLAGYMKKLGPRTLGQVDGRVINTHPSLLPRHGGQGMYGNRVHAAVIAGGESETGISVHLVDGDYDTGAILGRRRVAVSSDDDVESLAARVQAAEKPFLIEVLAGIADGSVSISGSAATL